ncbi:MAG: hypothetical protein N2112_06205 [Gemmataceae bacterium]|jgi:hypothetical protein|nr:hypothetical protein [Gemmataceae bacterium]
MFTTLLGVLVFGISSPLMTPTKENTTIDLEGVWEILILREGLSKEEQEEGRELIFFRNRMMIQIERLKSTSVLFRYHLKKLDGKNYIELVIFKEGKEKKLRGIYKVQMNVIEICVVEEESSLPEDFSPKEKHFYIKAKRIMR